MKENILIALVVILLGTMLVQISTQNSNNRYNVISAGNMLTVLVDQKTGETWRNCVCNEKSPIPGCWEKMHIVNPETELQPIGEAKLTKKFQKEAEKIKKQQEKLEKMQTKQEMPNNTTVIAPKQNETDKDKKSK